jgi:hypothetical protein
MRRIRLPEQTLCAGSLTTVAEEMQRLVEGLRQSDRGKVRKKVIYI